MRNVETATSDAPLMKTKNAPRENVMHSAYPQNRPDPTSFAYDRNCRANVAAGVFLVSRRSSQHSARVAPPMTRKAQKLARQPYSSSSAPPSIGASMGAMAEAMAT